MPTRQTADLRLFRISEANSFYFVTFCTERRRPGLSEAAIGPRILREAQRNDQAGDCRTVAFTVMPDHCHWLFELGSRLRLSQLVAKFKTRTREPLKAAGLQWQRFFYERQLRRPDEAEDYALYVFLNPYRAGLIDSQQTCPHWWTNDAAALRFLLHLDAKGAPPSEWIVQPVPEWLKVGE